MLKSRLILLATSARKFVALALTATILLASSLTSALAQSGGTGFLSANDSPSKIAAQTGGQGSIRGFVLTVINFFLGFLGIVAVIIIIYAGVSLVTSAGNPEKWDKAKKILMYTVGGIILIFASYAIVNTILGAPTGQEAS